MQLDPIYRQHHQQSLTFRLLYAFQENFILPLSHDEVVHGKASLIGKMPGTETEKFNNLRALFGYMYAHRARNCCSWATNLARWDEWYHDASLNWHLAEYPLHYGLMNWVEQLNRVYRSESALHWFDNDPKGFESVDCNDAPMSVVSLLRKGEPGRPVVIRIASDPHPCPTGIPGGRASGRSRRTSQQRRRRIWRR